MFAVIKTGGKQYSVESGKTLKVEKVEGKEGDTLSFDKVMIISDKSKQTLGTPIIEGAKVKAKIVKQIRGKKIVIFKKKRRKNYRSTQGHRQYLTVVKIEQILDSSKSSQVKEKVDNKIEVKNKKVVRGKPSTAKKIPIKKTLKKKVAKKTIKKDKRGK